jgi:hypothetical protein
VGEYYGEGVAPIEGVDTLAFIYVDGVEEGLVALVVKGGKIGADKAVPATNIVIKGAERLAGGCGVKPKGELGDFDRLLVDIYAVDGVLASRIGSVELDGPERVKR